VRSGARARGWRIQTHQVILEHAQAIAGILLIKPEQAWLLESLGEKCTNFKDSYINLWWHGLIRGQHKSRTYGCNCLVRVGMACDRSVLKGLPYSIARNVVKEEHKLAEDLQPQDITGLLDPLTGLSNRFGLETFLELMEKKGVTGPLSVVTVELARFGSVNDSSLHQQEHNQWYTSPNGRTNKRYFGCSPS